MASMRCIQMQNLITEQNEALSESCGFLDNFNFIIMK